MTLYYVIVSNVIVSNVIVSKKQRKEERTICTSAGVKDNFEFGPAYVVLTNEFHIVSSKNLVCSKCVDFRPHIFVRALCRYKNHIRKGKAILVNLNGN